MVFSFDHNIDIHMISEYLSDSNIKVIGNFDRTVEFAAPIDDANKMSIAFCSANYFEGAKKIKSSSAGIIFCLENVLQNLDLDQVEATLLIVENPMLQFNRLIKRYLTKKNWENANENEMIESNCNIQNSALLAPNVLIGNQVKVGSDTFIDSFSVICNGTKIGSNVSIGPNCSIGIDGLAYATDEQGNYEKFIHLGKVIIEDQVDIGANSCIVKGILQETIIGKGTKIGNLVNIGHNVKIGEHCFISAGAVLCGSVIIENRCWIAPQASILNHVRIGSGATVGLGAVVTKDVDPNSVVVGNPARPIKRKGAI